VLDKNGVKMGKVLQALRLAITGVGAGPDLMHIIELLGKEEVSKRLNDALAKLDHKVIA
jgi:glutamyl-tRNA synthetase